MPTCVVLRLIPASRFMIGLSVAIPTASLCINRRLYYIASMKSATITEYEKRRANMADLAIGLGIPVLEMVLRASTRTRQHIQLTLTSIFISRIHRSRTSF